jgi:hypothetical protein
MDRIMAFGFFFSFVTVVLLGYRRQLRTCLPVIPVSLSCCMLYGFLAGAWPLGFCLLAISAAETGRWWKQIRVTSPARVRFDAEVMTRVLESESRITRMFGRA